MEAIGVIIGRFQIHQLHDAHRDLINHVLENHKKVILFLGVSPILSSKRNPLDFVSRRLMIQAIYNDRLTILPMRDQANDEVWSKEIDKRIGEIYQGSAILYGSRDSFIPHYKGRHKTHELESRILVSGTEIRKNVSEETLSSAEFRAGMIYARYNTYPSVFPTVDIAIQRGDDFLFGKKPGESLYRFIGGFVDPLDDSEEVTCRREAMEETCCEVDGFKFIASMRVDDWRYRKEENKIMTHFYLGQFIAGRPQPADDISEIRWFKKDEVTEEQIVTEHRPLLKKLKEFLLKK
jgi:bifunctional NMN adenylyltransferase/nudix hydrolase